MPRKLTERTQLLEDWKMACDGLYDALKMPAGAPPRQWPQKIALARQAEASLARVIQEWDLFAKDTATVAGRARADA